MIQDRKSFIIGVAVGAGLILAVLQTIESMKPPKKSFWHRIVGVFQ